MQPPESINPNDPPHTWRAQFTSDPSTSFVGGEELLFSPIPMVFAGLERASSMAPGHSCRGVILALVFKEEFTHTILGSAVLVAPGIALSAWHVFQAAGVEAMMKGNIGVAAIGLTDYGANIWRVRKVQEVGGTDLCILSLEAASALPPNNKFEQAIITTRLPSLGEKLVVAGFISAEKCYAENLDSNAPAKGNIYVCCGPIVDLHLTGRDRVLAPWSAVSVDCPSWGGMSGGPVFDESGKLIGILSRSFDEGPSLVAMIWHALTCQIDGGWPAPIFQEKTSLIEMDPRICVIDDRSVIRFSRNQDGTTTTDYRIPATEELIAREGSAFEII